MKLLAVVAHPDDASIFCGGTLAKHADRGDDVHVVHMTRGEYGGLEQESQVNLADRRTEEARSAAQRIGADVFFLEFHDGRIEYSLENRDHLNDTIREHAPDLVFTHTRYSNHPDHRVTGRLVTDACYQASLPRVDSKYDPVDPDNVYYFGKKACSPEPDVLVDVTNYLDMKEEAVQCHESQMEFLAEHGGLDRSFDDLVEDVRARARTLGDRSGVRYAEGFTTLRDEVRDYLG